MRTRRRYNGAPPSGTSVALSRFKSGKYYAAGRPHNNYATAGNGSGFMTVLPLLVPTQTSFDRIAARVNATTASTVFRMGIYADDGGGEPGARVLDAGTIDLASGTGMKEITIAQTLAAGLYWLAGVGQGGTPSMYCLQPFPMLPMGEASGDIGGNNTSAYMSAVTGALPATWVRDSMLATGVYAIWLRAA